VYQYTVVKIGDDCSPFGIDKDVLLNSINSETVAISEQMTNGRQVAMQNGHTVQVLNSIDNILHLRKVSFVN
jgi:hypothetical protein